MLILVYNSTKLCSLDSRKVALPQGWLLYETPHPSLISRIMLSRSLPLLYTKTNSRDPSLLYMGCTESRI